MNKTAAIIALLAIAGATTQAYHIFQADRVLFRRGERSFAGGDFQKAADYYAAALAGGLKSPALLSNLTEAYFALGEKRKASTVLNEFISEYPDESDALFRLGSWYLREGSFDEAADIYRHILRRLPENAAARLYLARALTWAGQPDQAIREYRILLGEPL